MRNLQLYFCFLKLAPSVGEKGKLLLTFFAKHAGLSDYFARMDDRESIGDFFQLISDQQKSIIDSKIFGANEIDVAESNGDISN